MGDVVNRAGEALLRKAWSGGQEQRQVRRLITLISAGRDRTIMIRRELPPTRDAGCAMRRYRIKRGRILLSVSSGRVTGTMPSPPNCPEKACHSLVVGKGLGHLRQVQSRPSVASRREACRGGSGATQINTSEWQATLGGLWWSRPLRFGGNRDGPDKHQQFPADRSYDLRLLLACGGQFFIARMQPPLRFFRQSL